MRPISPRFSFFRCLGAVCALATVGLLGACDRHSAEEVPESYGHGSNRKPSFDNHQIDSRAHSKSYSDTQGTDLEEGHHEAEHKAAPAESPTPSQPGRFFPGGS